MTLEEMVDQGSTQELNNVRFHQAMDNRVDDFQPSAEFRYTNDMSQAFAPDSNWIASTSDVPTLSNIDIAHSGRIITETETREMINDLKTELKEEMDSLKKEVAEFKEELRFLKEV